MIYGNCICDIYIYQLKQVNVHEEEFYLVFPANLIVKDIMTYYTKYRTDDYSMYNN